MYNHTDFQQNVLHSKPCCIFVISSWIWQKDKYNNGKLLRQRALDRDASNWSAPLPRDFRDFPRQLFLSTESF